MGQTLGTVAAALGVFAVLVAVWCAAGSHRRVVAIVQRFGHWIVPLVFMLIGGVIGVEPGVLAA